MRQKDRKLQYSQQSLSSGGRGAVLQEEFKSSIIIVYGHQGVFREALSYCYWPGSVAVHEMEANQSLSRQSVFESDRPIQSPL